MFSNRRKLTLDLVRETQAVQKPRRLTLNLDQLMQAGQWGYGSGSLLRIERVPVSVLLHPVPVLGWSAGAGSFRPAMFRLAKTRGRE